MRYTKKKLPDVFYATLKRSKSADERRYTDDTFTGIQLSFIIDNHLIVEIYKNYNDLKFDIAAVIRLTPNNISNISELRRIDDRLDELIGHDPTSGNTMTCYIRVDEIEKIYTYDELLAYVKEH